MYRSPLATGETITYRTQTGGRVVVRPADDRRPEGPDCFEAECEVCRTPHAADRTSLAKVTEWARDHAARCTALPKNYIDVEAEAVEHAGKADKLLTEIKNSSEPERFLPRLEGHLRLAAVYTELARIQP